MERTRRIQAIRSMQATAVTVDAHLRRTTRALTAATEAMTEFRRAWDRSYRV